MKKNTLDQEEQSLLDAFESGDYQSTLTAERKAALESLAAQTFKKDKRINIRISHRDPGKNHESHPFF